MKDKRLEKLESELSTLKINLKNMERNINNYKTELVIKDKHFDKNSVSLEFSNFWECQTSPTGYCVYDRYSDYSCDSCIYCGEPNDRR